jgi:hypothetical protein
VGARDHGGAQAQPQADPAAPQTSAPSASATDATVAAAIAAAELDPEATSLLDVRV